MIKISKKRLIGAIICVFLSVQLLVYIGNYNTDAFRLYAKEGVLDARDLSWDGHVKYSLSGEWEVYDGLLLSPSQLEENIEQSNYLTKVRGSLDRSKNERTYRLRIMTDERRVLSLLLSDMQAFRLWVNGKEFVNYRFPGGIQEIHRMHVVRLDEEDYIASEEGYELDIVMQAKNRINYREFPWRIFIGPCAVITGLEYTNLIVNSFAIGIYFIIMIYSFSLYKQKTSEKYLLFLGLLSFGSIITTLLDSNLLLIYKSIALKSQYWRELIRFFLIFNLVMINIIYHLLHFEVPMNKKHKCFLVSMLIIATITTIYPFERWITVANFLHIWMGRVLVFVNFITILRAYLIKKTSIIMLIGGLSFTISYIFDLLHNQGFMPVGIVNVWISTSQHGHIFMVLCALIVAQKFAQKYDDADRFAYQLEFMNQNLGKIVEDKTSQLKQSYEENMKIEKDKQNFVLNISHDLRSPLFIVQGYIDAIVNGIVTEKEDVDRYLKRVQIKTQYLNRLIGDLFLISRLETNKIKFKFDKLNLIQLIKQVVIDMNLEANKKDIQLEMSLELEEFIIEGDQNRLQQVIQNVVINSIKYTPSDGKVKVLIVEYSKKDIIFEVRDNGIGIKEEELPIVFNRYYKSKKMEYSEDSTGLGLFIAKEIVEKHKGSIWIESVFGEGTSVFIRLPVRQNGYQR